MRRLLLAWLLAVTPAAVQATSTVDHLAEGSYAARAVEGARIAARWCDTCHMVRRDRGRDVAQPFAVIAAHRSPEEIRGFLAHPHGGMPAIDLSNEQIAAIIAFMKSLDTGSDITPAR